MVVCSLLSVAYRTSELAELVSSSAIIASSVGEPLRMT
jgi:hypothetical protein